MLDGRIVSGAMIGFVRHPVVEAEADLVRRACLAALGTGELTPDFRCSALPCDRMLDGRITCGFRIGFVGDRAAEAPIACG
ncbi:hypothetical protein [Nocardia colli]|uniref:hypothetical protein n=1 Tax=Nocardia colli TaxID=2545717 RepID=UPI0035E12138